MHIRVYTRSCETDFARRSRLDKMLIRLKAMIPQIDYFSVVNSKK